MLFSRSLLFIHFKYNSVYKSISSSLPFCTLSHPPTPHSPPSNVVKEKEIWEPCLIPNDFCSNKLFKLKI